MPDIIGFRENIRVWKNGFEDVMAYPRGKIMFAIECKSSTGKLSPDQIKFKEYFEASGGLYIVARKAEDVEGVL